MAHDGECVRVRVWVHGTGAYYAFVSSPDFQFAPYFLEVDFWFATVTGLQQLVHGTFMTKAAWRVRTPSATQLLILADAMTPGQLPLLYPPTSFAPLARPHPHMLR
jgi:hypothetical protein